MCSDDQLRRAVKAGDILRLRRGRYALPSVEQHRLEAHRRSAVLSHLSAAQAHGWPVKWPPQEPWITVPRNRKMPSSQRAGLQVTYRDLTADERHEGVTSPLRTGLDCAMKLPFDEGLAVADSALRAHCLDRELLVAAARELHGRGSSKARRVAAAADARAANPLESVLRAIALDVPGLTVVPQVQVADAGLFATVDLADESAKVVLEAEGYEFHGGRRALVRDCRRYTELVVHGWRVLRYTWDDVMLRPAWVRWTLEAFVAVSTGRPVPPLPRDERAMVA